ncbi:hypothetical protein [Rhizobium rhizogenes]|uniref:hypothetical protein n=1 Tax=Rhizobium rhizogenes TaxID=359 RepID=UPI0022718FDC|nr:hypothetical protein [Rhizobium rhizogenes]
MSEDNKNDDGYQQIRVQFIHTHFRDTRTEGIPFLTNIREKGLLLNDKGELVELSFALAADQTLFDNVTSLSISSADAEPFEKQSEQVPPPSSYWAEILAPTDKAIDFVINLEEVKWARWVAKYGTKQAKWLWYAQIGHFVFLHWLGVAVDLAKALPALIKLG